MGVKRENAETTSGFAPSGNHHCFTLLGSGGPECMQHRKLQASKEVYDFEEQGLLNSYYMAVLLNMLYTLIHKTYSAHERVIEISLTKVWFQSWHKISLSSVPGIKWQYNKFQLNMYLNFRLSDLNYNLSWQTTHLFRLISPSHCFGRSHSKL